MQTPISYVPTDALLWFDALINLAVVLVVVSALPASAPAEPDRATAIGSLASNPCPAIEAAALSQVGSQ